jgi:hypothetical protein
MCAMPSFSISTNAGSIDYVRSSKCAEVTTSSAPYVPISVFSFRSVNSKVLYTMRLRAFDYISSAKTGMRPTDNNQSIYFFGLLAEVPLCQVLLGEESA